MGKCTIFNFTFDGNGALVPRVVDAMISVAKNDAHRSDPEKEAIVRRLDYLKGGPC